MNQKDYARRWREKHPEKQAARLKEWRNANREKARSWGRRWRDNNRVKRNVHSQVAYALAVGWLVRPVACEECAQEKLLTAHHDDYGKPYVVRWLCHKCHALWHKLNGEGKAPDKEGGK